MKINYEDFKCHIDSIEKLIRFDDALRDLSCEFGYGYVEIAFPTNIKEQINTLEKLFEDKIGLLQYFIYETDFGKAYDSSGVIKKFGYAIPLSNTKELYNALVGNS